jgi:hypothetical protein
MMVVPTRHRKRPRERGRAGCRRTPPWEVLVGRGVVDEQFHFDVVRTDGRVGLPAEVGKARGLPCSPVASYIAGAGRVIDGVLNAILAG